MKVLDTITADDRVTTFTQDDKDIIVDIAWNDGYRQTVRLANSTHMLAELIHLCGLMSTPNIHAAISAIVEGLRKDEIQSTEISETNLGMLLLQYAPAHLRKQKA